MATPTRTRPTSGSECASDWRRIIDTSLDSPLDFCEFPEAPVLAGQLYRAEARSVVVLACRRLDGDD